MPAISSPYAQFFDTDGSPLDNGSIYFGITGTNPFIPANQVPLFWDEAKTQPAAQPIKTINGYISRAGAPAQLFADVAYSCSIYDKVGRLVAYSVNGQAGGVIDLTIELASSNGSSMIGYDGGTVQDVLDGAKTLKNYAELLAYNGRATDIRLTDPVIAGQFHYNVAGPNTTNGGTQFAHFSGVGSWERRYSGAVMIPWFTQGTANDTAALQAAFSAGKAIRDGGASYTYSIDGTITLQDGQNMLFSGAEFKQLGVQKPMFDAKNKKRIRASYGRFTGLLETVYLNSASSQAIGFAIEGANDVIVSDCEFENFMYSPIMSNAGANNVTFSDNRVKGPGASYFTDPNMRGTTGFTLGGTNTVVSGNEITGTTQGGIITQGSQNIVVSGNIIHDIVNEHGLYLDTALSCVTVSGNTIRNTGVAGTGIKVQLYDTFGQPSTNVSITGNSVYSSGSTSISIINTVPTTPLLTSSVSVTGNAVYASSQDGISLRYARGASVSGNAVYGASRYGIELLSSTQITISGNTTVNTGTNGIFDFGCSDATYVGNTILFPGQTSSTLDGKTGFLVITENEHFISNNVIRGSSSMSYGIWVVNGGNSLSVIDNSITGGTGASMRLPGSQIRFFRGGPMNGSLGRDVVDGLPTALQRGEQPGIYWGTAAPTTGTWVQGNRVNSLLPVAGGNIGWVCVVAGTPGTWKTFGTVAA